MHITTEIDRNCLIVRLSGELDMHSVPEFKDKTIKLMENNNLKHLILNLKGVKFIDSSGVGAILGRYRDLKDKGGKVMLVSLKPQVEKIFELSGMLKIMSVFNNEEDALAGLNSKGGNHIA
ncbi:anti-sigma F factor antagonist [Halothermothrix orenii]|uniref:Anti-sigma F factor antagonist n=1 Tax=Halothermothrix orenii (strain H 168 / OCM 544 / DSM 9562) TaxID=373903 RepID=B8CVY8_HALOH|nr:anti-sigma F factor antagonist [Halothermothrix orenii]ACL69457.1 anti-sigma-factor antagonist spoIIAA [Halothermothrix orenii H 168]